VKCLRGAEKFSATARETRKGAQTGILSALWTLWAVLGLPASATGLRQAPATAPSPTSQSTSARSSASTVVKLPDATPVEIELSKTVSSKEAHEGDSVAFSVVQPVKVDGVIVIERGAEARGGVRRARRAARASTSGILVLVLEDVQAVDGSRVPLRFAKPLHRGRKAEIAGQILVATVDGIETFGALMIATALLPHALAHKGKDESIAAGERYEVYVNGPAQVRIDSPPESKPPH
jgi:hypothetical protein